VQELLQGNAQTIVVTDSADRCCGSRWSLDVVIVDIALRQGNGFDV
jgi:hypothetical protein